VIPCPNNQRVYKIPFLTLPAVSVKMPPTGFI